MDSNKIQKREATSATRPSAGGSSVTSTADPKSQRKPEPAPPPMTRNLDVGPSLPVLTAGGPGKSTAQWLWIAIAVGIGVVIAVAVWLAF